MNNGKHEIEVSIFLVSDQEFRRRVVEKINQLIIDNSKLKKDISALEDMVNDLNLRIDDVEDSKRLE